MNTSKSSFNFIEWFVHNWSRTALPGGIVLIFLAPLTYKLGGLPLLLIYLHLPFYMIHQYEEHAEGKFKAMVNRMLAGGVEKITDVPIFWVNIIAVWIIYSVAIDASALVSLGFGLMVAYTTLLNAILHILPTVKERVYNPGVLTSVVLFLPVSIYTISVLSQRPETTAAYQLLGIGTAVVIHVITFASLISIARRK